MEGLFWFCLCFLVSPGLTLVPDPAECLVSGIHNLIRLPTIKNQLRCYQDCLDEPNCHMAVVSNPLCGHPQCLLVNCLNQGNRWLLRDPSAKISVFSKAHIGDDRRSFLMKAAYGRANERSRCFSFREGGRCATKSTRFFYNRDSSSCEQVSVGCWFNRNTFRSRRICETFCNRRQRCTRPVEYGARPPSRFSNLLPETGPPDPSAPHNFFFHNVSSGRCEGFHFRGSLSNGNIFSTVEECQQFCGDVKARCVDFMEYRSSPPRFFYNRTSYRCEQVFSGFGSNRKTFDTLEGCEALCNEKYLCYRPVEHGQSQPVHSRNPQELPESAAHNFHYYNVANLRCEGFHFRGSGSNGNIFSTVEKCERLCGHVDGTRM